MASGDVPLATAPWLAAPESRRVLAALAADGRPARFVGGCVRDALLDPARDVADLDLATPERPERVMALCRAAGLKVIPTGLKHGTVTVHDGARTYEVTTLRRDVATDGRHAVVEFTDDFAADAARRDFTINAMSCDAEGRLFDPFNGREDLAAGRVRFVGDARARIVEDYLRILRYFRFYARFGRAPVDAEALGACAALAGGIGRLSGERVRQELLKLLVAPGAVASLGLMREAGVLGHVLPEADTIEPLERVRGGLASSRTTSWRTPRGGTSRSTPWPATGRGGCPTRSGGGRIWPPGGSGSSGTRERGSPRIT
jgi:poly(A) polymerase